ncbi:MAG: diguanylate cyclase [Rhodoferax sp.]|nr:diguanylate cyclase [Rhodoferax sp.]
MAMASAALTLPRRLACALALALTLVVVLLAPAPARAVLPAVVPADRGELPLRAHLDVLEDASRQWGIDDVDRPDQPDRFRRMGGTGDLNFGITDSAYWIRITLRADSTVPIDRLLEVAHPSLDRVDFFDRSPAGTVHLNAGYTLPFNQRPVAHRHLVFPLRLEPGVTHTVLLRVISRGSLTVPVRLWTAEALSSSDQTAYTVLAVYFGMIFALSVYNLLLYLSLRDPVYLLYTGFAASLALAQAAMSGFGSQFLWPHAPPVGDAVLPSCFSLGGLFGALFVQRFLDTRSRMPRLNRLISGVQFGFLACAIGPALAPNPPFAIATALLGTLFCAISLLCGLIGLRQHQPSAGLFLAATGALLLGVSAFALRTLGWIPTTFITSNGMLLGSALEMMMLSLSMAHRIHALRQEAARAQAEALRSRQSAMEVLQHSERQLERRIAERTAELAQANERLQRSEAVLKTLALQDALTGLANRNRLQEQLRQAVARSRREAAPLAVLMIDLDGFKPVNDRLGHAAGDELLIEIGRRLRAAVRANDTVARVGGDEFVVLMEGIQSRADAEAAGAKLIASIREPMTLGGSAVSVHVGASVGLALCPDQSDDIDQLLRLADQDMYRAKALGRV